MENFKIELFENEHQQSFPVYRALTKPECQKLLDSVSTKYGINPSNFAAGLASIQSFYGESNATEEFSLINTFNNLSIKYMSDIFINWYNFERVDVFRADTLDKHFGDIWFPISDDIDLFDKSFGWILSIRHDGCITFIK